MKVTFNQLTMKNFWTFGNEPTVIDLNTGESHFVLGENRDNGSEGMSRNGVGKSGILQGMCFALFGAGFADIRIDEFINFKNKKGMVVTLSFTAGTAEYVITRKRKPNSLEITKNGEPFTLATGKNEDEAIVELLGYDADIFMNTMMLTNNISNFVYLKPAAQKSIIERLLSMETLVERADTLKSHAKDTTVEISTEETTIRNETNANERSARVIEDMKGKSESWESSRAGGTTELESKLAELQSIDIESPRAANEKLRSELDILSKIGTEVDKLGRDIKRALSSKESLNAELETLRSGKCPRCEQDWISEPEILHVETQIETLEKDIVGFKEPLGKLLQHEATCKKTVQGLQDSAGELLTESQCRDIETQMKVLESKIETLQADDENPYTDQIKSVMDSMVEIDSTKLDNLKRIQEHEKFLLKLLTDSKSFIRKAIINHYVPIINQYVNQYLSTLESPNRFTINDDLTIDIIYMGRKIGIGSVSTGEKIRLSFCISMAFRNFLGMMGHDCNTLFIDEIFDTGMDLSGLHRIMEVLKKLDKSIFVISHKDDIIGEFDKVLTVIKENGFTTISESVR